ncbi:hypothetical protein [Pseudomonas violetae]|uniref:Uncharacterized protein n=1 Tax=Pseudomonas violetae TaxID=2915813 RepID=A0ABT0ETD3_9PSED|nr:hypothetical protein [Pseudomonas violetae]MCK1789003.1 hypothetical protein [Pseudomonas violetae]
MTVQERATGENSSSRAFPWESNGLTFRTRGELEQLVERFVTSGSPRHLAAARTLVNEAVANYKLTTDQYNDLKQRLHF